MTFEGESFDWRVPQFNGAAVGIPGIGKPTRRKGDSAIILNTRDFRRMDQCRSGCLSYRRLCRDCIVCNWILDCWPLLEHNRAIVSVLCSLIHFSSPLLSPSLLSFISTLSFPFLLSPSLSSLLSLSLTTWKWPTPRIQLEHICVSLIRERSSI